EETMTGYFRKILADNPKLLNKRSNKELFQRWMDDHPGHEKVPPQVKVAASNAKTAEKQKRKKRKKTTHLAASASGEAGNGTRPSAPKPSAKVLQSLEEQIDNCIAFAKNLDPQGLEEVIQSLRHARNEI